MTARPTADSQQRIYEVAVVGNDMLLAALPGRPVQLAHALQAAGFDLVVPVSWGEEVLADHTVRMLGQVGPRPIVFCSCPRVRQRLTQAGNELAPHLMSTVAPPVATARYLRGLHPGVSLRITYLGTCEGARDSSIDVRVAPLEYLSHLEQRGISVVGQPTVFDAVIPPDRRRHWSLPGGIPTRSALKERGCAHSVTVLSDDDVVAQIADHLLLGDAVLIDMAPVMGCACTGSIKVHQTMASREALAALEPPRSALPVIDADARVPVEVVIPHLTSSPPAVARTPLSLEGRSPKSDAALAAPAIHDPPTVASIESRPAAPRPVARPRIAVTPSSIPRVDVTEHQVPPAPREPAPPGTPTPIALRMLTAQPTPAPSNETSPPAAPRRRTPTHGLHHVARQGPGIRLNTSGSEVTRAYAALRGRRSGPPDVLPPVDGATEAPVSPSEPEERALPELVAAEPPGDHAGAPAPTPDEVAADETTTGVPPGEESTSPDPAHIDIALPKTDVSDADTRAPAPARSWDARSHRGPEVLPSPTGPEALAGRRRPLWGLLASVVAIVVLTVVLKLVFDP